MNAHLSGRMMFESAGLPRKNIFLVLLIFFVSARITRAEAVNSISEVGPHERLLILEKNENPQNLLAVYTRYDDACRPLADAQDSSRPFLDFYWLMDGRRFKPVHSMIKSGIRERLRVERGAGTQMRLRLDELSELDQDLRQPVVEIKTERVAGQCQSEALLTLGPSDKGVVLRLKKIRTQSHPILLPPFRRVDSITLIGDNARTHQPLERKFNARP